MLWYIATTSVVLGGCRRAFTVKGEKSMPKGKYFRFPLIDEMHLFIKVGLYHIIPLLRQWISTSTVPGTPTGDLL